MTVAPDGSPIELYLRLPSLGEAERVHDAIDPGAEILELGCGVGRVTHDLLRLGHPVTAVDESAEMLAHVRGATAVRASIERLDLARRFPCVLLMSQLVNDDEHRAEFLRACARHLAPDGIVVIERHPPDWRPEAGVRRTIGDVEVELEDVVVEPPFLAATVRYESDGSIWRQPFRAHLLDDAELDAALRDAGLRFARTLDDGGTWVEARLYSGA